MSRHLCYYTITIAHEGSRLIVQRNRKKASPFPESKTEEENDNYDIGLINASNPSPPVAPAPLEQTNEALY